MSRYAVVDLETGEILEYVRKVPREQLLQAARPTPPAPEKPAGRLRLTLAWLRGGERDRVDETAQALFGPK